MTKNEVARKELQSAGRLYNKVLEHVFDEYKQQCKLGQAPKQSACLEIIGAISELKNDIQARIDELA